MGAAPVTLLLPARARFGGKSLPDAVGRWLARADREAIQGAPAARAFDVLPRGWPAAAVTRERDAGDAAGALWLRADPAWVRPDINGARLLAHGEALGLTQADAEALLATLRPLFGDAGWALDAPVPSRWYLRLPPGTPLPRFTAPADALGEDLFEHLPDDVEGRTAEARRWRALLSEAQIALHHHPLNAARASAGRAPVNSVWFWGAGELPHRLATRHPAFHSDDEVVHAFATRAGAAVHRLPASWPAEAASGLYDLRGLRDPGRLVDDWLHPAVLALAAGRIGPLELDFGEHERRVLRRSHRWRVWRRPLTTLLDPFVRADTDPA